MTSSILVPVTIVVLLGVLAAAMLAVMRMGIPEALSGRFALRGYLHLASVVSSLVIAFGLVSLVTAGVTLPAGRGFSYQVTGPRQAISPPERFGRDPEEMRHQLEERAEAQFKDDVVRGLALTSVGLLLWGLHTAGLRITENADERRHSWLNRLHRLGLLAIFGASGLIALPLGTYELARYYVVGSVVEFHTQPGSSVAIAIVFVPIWLYELWHVLRVYRQPGDTIGVD